MKGTVDKLLGFMKLGDDEYEEYEEDYEEVDDDDDDRRSTHTFSIFNKKEKYEEEEEDSVVQEKPKRTYNRSVNSKVVSMSSRGGEVNVIKPRDFSEAKLVADLLRQGKTVVINMEDIVNPEAQRTIDFVGGACYAVDGTLQAISRNIFIAAPDDIEVSGDLRDEIMNESIVSPTI